jgi:hypothetical protein
MLHSKHMVMNYNIIYRIFNHMVNEVNIIKVENKIQSTMLILLGWIGHLHPLTIVCVYFRWFLPLRLQIQHK